LTVAFFYCRFQAGYKTGHKSGRFKARAQLFFKGNKKAGVSAPALKSFAFNQPIRKRTQAQIYAKSGSTAAVMPAIRRTLERDRFPLRGNSPVGIFFLSTFADCRSL